MLRLTVSAADGAGISWLHRNSEVLSKDLREDEYDMIVRVDETKRDQIIRRFNAEEADEA